MLHFYCDDSLSALLATVHLQPSYFSVTHGPTDDELSQVMKTQQHVTLYTLLCFCSQKATCSCKICGYFDLVSNMLLEIEQLLKATIHQAMLLQAICGYFDLQATLLPRIETCSILGNTLLTTSKSPQIACNLW